MAVGGFHACGQGGSAGTGVGNELIGAVCAGDADVGEVVEVELALVQHPGAAYLLQAHAVANHYYDVFDLVGDGGHLNVYDVVGVGGLVVLEDLFLVLLA